MWITYFFGLTKPKNLNKFFNSQCAKLSKMSKTFFRKMWKDKNANNFVYKMSKSEKPLRIM